MTAGFVVSWTKYDIFTRRPEVKAERGEAGRGTDASTDGLDVCLFEGPHAHEQPSPSVFVLLLLYGGRLSRRKISASDSQLVSGLSDPAILQLEVDADVASRDGDWRRDSVRWYVSRRVEWYSLVE